MRIGRAVALVLAAGVLTFGLVFTLLQVSRLEAAAGAGAAGQAPPVTRVGRAPDSLASSVAPGRTLVGVPVLGAETLLHDVRVGDRLDVLVSLPGGNNSGPLTAVAVRGATVVRPVTSSDPLLVEVPDPDALLLAHLVLGGQRLSYALWPAGGSSPPTAPAIDEPTLKRLLGLEPTPTPVTPTPIPAPTLVLSTPLPAAAPPAGIATSGFIYQVQPGDTWDILGGIFGVPPTILRRWNDAPDDAPLTAGTLIIVPRQPR